MWCCPAFMKVPGYIVYKNKVVGHDHGVDLDRDIILETECEDTAQRLVAEELAADPTMGSDWVYYEYGLISI